MSESPNKPEATAGPAEATAKKELFSEREEKVLKFAWQCLKSGPPDVDIKKLTHVAGFNTEKTASNTWGVIKKKLATLEAVDGESTVEGASGNTGTATSKKRAKKDGDGSEAPTPSKKSRKPAKNKKAATVEEDSEPSGDNNA